MDADDESIIYGLLDSDYFDDIDQNFIPLPDGVHWIEMEILLADKIICRAWEYQDKKDIEKTHICTMCGTLCADDAFSKSGQCCPECEAIIVGGEDRQVSVSLTPTHCKKCGRELFFDEISVSHREHPLELALRYWRRIGCRSKYSFRRRTSNWMRCDRLRS